MSNTLVQATAEGLPTPDREISPLERMQGMASAWMNATPEAREHALAASRTSSHEEVTALMTHQSPVSLAIQQHNAALSELDSLGTAHSKAEVAHIAAGRANSELQIEFEAVDVALNEACSRQEQACEAVLSAPVTTFADMQEKAAHLIETAHHTIHDGSTMRMLLASVAPGQETVALARPAFDLFPAAASGPTLSHHVNELFGSYVAIEAEQMRLGDLGTKEADDKAEALASPALALMEKINTIRDRSGNADLIAATVLLDLMLTNRWDRVIPGYEWRFGEEKEELRRLERVADQTTGIVREHTRLALATIGVEITPEVADPMLALVTEYRTQLDIFNASPPTLTNAENAALEAKTWARSYAVLHGGEVPDATTLPGVLAALRELHREFVDCGGADEMAIAMLPAVVAFFDAEAAQAMRERAAAVAGS